MSKLDQAPSYGSPHPGPLTPEFDNSGQPYILTALVEYHSYLLIKPHQASTRSHSSISLELRNMPFSRSTVPVVPYRVRVVRVPKDEITCVSASDNVSGSSRTNLPNVFHSSDPATRLSLTYPSQTQTSTLRYASTSSGQNREVIVQFDTEKSLTHRTNLTILQKALKEVYKTRSNRQKASNLERSVVTGDRWQVV